MKKLFWGNSVSSMQTEGAWNEGGAGMSVYDIREATENSSDWKVATDSYHRYLEDFDYMKEMGMNMYRFQTSWSRVCPTGDGDWNEEGFEFYDKFIDDLIERDIEPMICLYHFDMPLDLAKKYNGFVSKEATEAFIRYGKEVVDRYSNKVKHWLTFNEQNLFFMPDHAFVITGYLEGERTRAELLQIQHNTAYAHAAIANYIHETTDAQISGMVAYSQVYPASPHPENIRMTREHNEFCNYAFLDVAVKGRFPNSYINYRNAYLDELEILPHEEETMTKCTSDYLTFSYYASTTIEHAIVPVSFKKDPFEYLRRGKKDNPFIDTTEWNWQVDPAGFRDIFNKIYNRYDLPVFCIENGLGVDEKWDGKNEIQDDYRIEYMRDHLKEMMNAKNIDGVEVMGYLGWGLIDILSSQGDMRKRYGLVYVNRDNHDLKDLKRVPKKSFYWFKKVTESNGEEL